MNLSDVKRVAKEKTNGKKMEVWGAILIVGIVNGAITRLVDEEILLFLLTFLTYPLQVGFIKYVLNLYRGKEADIHDIFDEYKNYKVIILTSLLMTVILTCGYILFFVPGIIWTLGYAFVYYLIADGVTGSPKEILKKSKEMMNGYKMDYFLLNLSFIGWIILGIFTFGILYIWLIPYMTFAEIEFYERIRTK